MQSYRGRPYIAEIRISPAIEAKIRAKHSISPEEIRDAALFNRYGRWNSHPEHGRRLIIRGLTYEDKMIQVFLKPVNADEGIWRCLSAWMIA
jgi:hypothetical protein